ncbi:Retrovirus-related Pol polyprotein from transposon TNT 1-94 [Dendrobium catenatum]|uniref:Retrovirus-related Pol polyprotein from transposon TNT 1-94 n=1 Tax=Dendrobium catenatum TaxID=906689 RepID=A0A2I0WPA6_9ASPA|nr:Retrovirus-related Pol polyprotein from transposon TNT 1-94 [Dendrobium catenatum]
MELGEACKILGMEILMDKMARKVWLSQGAYVRKVLKKFVIDDSSKAVSLHLASHFQLSSYQFLRIIKREKICDWFLMLVQLTI